MMYWYEFFHSECVLCGKSDTYRERRYTPKPEGVNERHHFAQNACPQHFI